eukprot:10209937-Lingulodinium_polyedra.AAC.1
MYNPLGVATGWGSRARRQVTPFGEGLPPCAGTSRPEAGLCMCTVHSMRRYCCGLVQGGEKQ